MANYVQAEIAARRLISEFKISRPPIDPEAIAEAKGVSVLYSTFGNGLKDKVSGFIQFNPLQIIVNEDLVPNRKTFTIAHELGHYLLHREYAQSNNYQVLARFNDYGVDKPNEEKEADCFAANLLVPMSFLKEYKNLASTRELARIFLVSEDVILNRLKRA